MAWFSFEENRKGWVLGNRAGLFVQRHATKNLLQPTIAKLIENLIEFTFDESPLEIELNAVNNKSEWAHH